MSDKLSILTILFRASSRVLMDDAISSINDSKSIPTDKASLKKYLDSKLGGVWEVQEKTETGGATSTYYSASTTNSTQPVKSVFVKLSSPTKGGRILDTILGIGSREVDAYWNLFPNNCEDIGIVIPKCLAAESSKCGSRSVLVLEDLSVKEDIKLSKPGDLRTGAEIRTILHSLAKMHAAFWGKAHKIPNKEHNSQSNFLAHTMAKSSLQTAKKDGLIAEGDIADRICTAVDCVGGFRGIKNLIDDLNPDARTLVHGDIGHGNNYVDADGNVGLLDWQTYQYGNPADDVAGLLLNDLSVEDFCAHSDGLISDYLDALRREMGTDVPIDHLFTIEQVKEAIRIKCGFNVVGSLLVLAMPSTEESLKEKIRNRWDEYLEKAAFIDAADALENHADEHINKEEENKLAAGKDLGKDKSGTPTSRTWFFGNRKGVHPVATVESV